VKKIRGRQRIVDNARDLAQVSAVVILECAKSAIAARGRFHFALAGGSTPRATYTALAQRAFETDFTRWHLWFGDERCVPPDHEDSNYRMASETLIGDRFPERQVHRLHGEAADPELEARRYQRELCEELTIPPRLDLVLLGLGADGHTAGLFPGTAALDEKRRWVTRGRAPKPPVERLTLTLPTLCRARAALFLVSGADKAAALAAARDEGDTRSRTASIPARRVEPESGVLLWVVDRAAAGS